ncbi:MAG: HU family DNA-binding protein [Anaerolineae bacterium]|jgi:DNA-binding protein HU-beta
MNKRDVITAVARQTDLTRKEARQALDAILETITQALVSGDPVAFSVFGRFEVREYPGRRLNRFDEAGHFAVEGRPVPTFKSSAALRRRLREAAGEE